LLFLEIKKPEDLKNIFSNSMFKCFVSDTGRLVVMHNKKEELS